MCGIYLSNIPITIDEVKNKIEKIKFRGPDHTGVQKVDDLTLAHLRLSILDLDARSNQPMNYKSLWITFNGEIYNYLDIKDELQRLGYQFTTTSDTEVLLMGYYEWGKDLMAKINGMFAFCIYDSTTKKIFGARDRMGVKPFYYFWQNGDFEICSQLRPISDGKNINKEVIPAYLECKYIPTPYSIFENTFKLEPGGYIEIDTLKKKFKKGKYWNLSEVENKSSKFSYEEAKEELHNLLKDAVKIRLQSDVPIGTFLSGGIDSSLVSAIASNQSKKQIKTFTIGFENPEYNESKIAEQYAEIIGSKHTTTICTSEDILNLIPEVMRVYDEPFADSSALPSLLLNKITKQYVTVALSGDGGDESFLGYNFFKQLHKYKPAFLIPKGIRKGLANSSLGKFLGVNNEAKANFLKLNDSDEFIRNVFLGNDTLTVKKDYSWFNKHYSDYKNWSTKLLQRAADLNIKLWLENDSNVKVDRASMAYSVEVRSPFLDYRIVELARKFPVDYRYKNGVGKVVLRDILEEYIPRDVFTQPKKGFGVPLGDWIRNELKEEFTMALSDDFLMSVPNLNVAKFKKQFKEHMEGKADYMANIWKLYVLRKWLDEFGFNEKFKRKKQLSWAS